MHALVHKIVLILSDIEHILSPRFEHPRRGKLFFDYLRIRTKAFANRWFHFKYERFLSYKVAVVDYDIFFVIFRQTFIRHTYYFKTSVEAPKIIDCGGNIGMTVLYFKYLYPKAVITVFEPSLEVVDILQKNVDQNKLTDITLVRAAVYDEEGSMVIYPRGVAACGNTLDKSVWEATDSRHTSEPYEIKTVILSTYIKDTVDFLKLDIEGGEGVVFHELAKTGALDRIKGVALEYHTYSGVRDNSLSSLLTLLETSGLRPELYYEDIEPAGVISHSLSMRAERS